MSIESCIDIANNNDGVSDTTLSSMVKLLVKQLKVLRDDGKENEIGSAKETYKEKEATLIEVMQNEHSYCM